MQYRDSALAFAVAHLESGEKAGLEAQRRDQLSYIIKNAFIGERGTNMAQFDWQKHDIKLIFGDLNFRNFGKLTHGEIMKLIE